MPIKRVIHKQHWFPRVDLGISVPSDAVILHVGGQMERLTVWYTTDGVTRCTRRLVVVGTGHEVPDGKHVGSAVVGEFVWHVFDPEAEDDA